MPQTLTPEWYEMLGAEAADIHGEWLHTIGNLTLTGYNPVLSNRSYAEKKTLFSASHFELNQHFGDPKQWGATEIEDRAKSLSKIAIQLGPRPEVAITEVPAVAEKASQPAAFHGDCIKLAQARLGWKQLSWFPCQPSVEFPIPSASPRPRTGILAHRHPEEIWQVYPTPSWRQGWF